jgi:arylformamidase
LIYDISVDLYEGFPVWPGDPRVALEPFLSQERGDLCNASRLACSVHSGTHVDAPKHFFPKGAGVDELPLDVLIGEAQVVRLTGARRIGVDDLQAVVAPETRRLLLRTDNSDSWTTSRGFEENFAALTPDAARWIVDQGIILIGIDYHSIQRFDDPTPETHEVLLAAGVVIVETLDLSQIEPGPYNLICLPLKLVGADGAPARVVLSELRR